VRGSADDRVSLMFAWAASLAMLLKQQSFGLAAEGGGMMGSW
jgi:hypothetical protein